MRTILLSFEADWFEKIESGEKKFEYRKHFPECEETVVYFYVSNPVKAITGIGYFGTREELSAWKELYADRGTEVNARIEDFLTDCRFAVPMYRFQKTNRLSLQQLRTDLSNFIVPRMYYYIDDTELLNYLQDNLVYEGEPIEHDFTIIRDEDIC